MYPDQIRELPIGDVLEQLRMLLDVGDSVVLQAPPGAGKTTAVPLVLLDENWLGGRSILLLQPRRMAARNAAARMAQLLGESVGQTVGYRMRMDSCVSDLTRIEVITEGILTRRLQQDPGLEDVGLIIFDEFHERNLDSDLCLALALQGRELFREGPPLKLLVMSATLDGEAVAELLGGAPLVTSAGRQFPVECAYGHHVELRDPIAKPTVRAIMLALREREGNVLVFLPGQREIKAVERQLAAALKLVDRPRIEVTPLFGGLSMERQQQAIQMPPAGVRKVVLSTNVAETSLTIEGIHTIVDSGLVREAIFDPSTGMTRLATRRISRASADQRMGRAGRLGPGFCYRLWTEEQQHRLVAGSTPEILQADLAPLALQLLAWGVSSPAEMAWLDTPPEAHYQQALDILDYCGAVFVNQNGDYQLTPHGVRLAQMPLHPRLAHMLLVGCDIHAAETACLLAAVLSERNPLASRGADIGLALEVLMGEAPCPPRLEGWFRRTWEQASRFARLASDIHKPRRFAMDAAQADVVGILLASAYPDRIARLRSSGDGAHYQLSGGRGALLPAEDMLVGQEWLAVAEVGGHVGESVDRIYSATALNPQTFRGVLSTLLRLEDQVEWDYRSDQFVAERRHLLGELVVQAEPLQPVPVADRSEALLGVIRKKGLGILPWHANLMQWRARVMLMHELTAEDNPSPWPDLSDDALLATLDDWLMPYLEGVQNLDDFRKLDLKLILHALLPWPLPLELERLLPDRMAVPSGSSVAIDYSQQPPVLAVKLQEMFGCEKAPTVADGRVVLQLHLLSPAGRPLQITQDLESFWRSGYAEVRREMQGRYPKHAWPEDPLQAAASRHSRHRVS